MKKLECDICGGKLVMQVNGIAACDSCGMEYSKESLREKVQEIKGTVKIEGAVETVKGDAEKERLLRNAETQISLGIHTEAQRVFESITKDYPDDYRGWWGIFRMHAMSMPRDINRQVIQRLDGYAQMALAVCDDQEREVVEKDYRDFYFGLSKEIDSGRRYIVPDEFQSIIGLKYALNNSSFIRWIEQHETEYKSDVGKIKEATKEWGNISLRSVFGQYAYEKIGSSSSCEEMEVKYISHFDGYNIFAQNSNHGYISGIHIILPEHMSADEIIKQIHDYAQQVKSEHQRKQQQQMKYKQEEQSRLWERQGLCKYCGGSLGILGNKCRSCGKSAY